MKLARFTLTRQELEIMKIVWRLEQATVRQVYEEILTGRKVAYTTVMTMMKILTAKGFLKKNRDERAFVYSATKKRKQVMAAMVRDFVDRVFNGSAKPLLVHLVEDRQLSAADIREISDLIEKKS